MYLFLLRFRQDDRGAVAITMALMMTVIISFAALAVDTGYLYLKSRQLQGTADLAALSAAAHLDHADAAAQAVVAANESDAVSVQTQTGVYDPASGSDPASRFKAGASGDSASNAARVVLTDHADLFFGRIWRNSPVAISRTATASNVQMAAFSIGSRLVSLNGGVANALLSGLTGSQISLSVMDYNALVGAKVDLLSYVQALHTKANLTAASFSDTLNSQISVGDALDVLIGQSDIQNNPSLKAPLTVLANSAVRNTKIRLGDLIDTGVYGDQDHIVGGVDSAIHVSSMALVNALLELANADRQVQLDLSAQVPSLAGVKVWLAIGERPNHSPWLTVTRSGDPIIRTAQARLYIEASVAANNALLKPLGVTGVRLPVYVELASAQAKLSAISCDASGHSVNLLVSPSIGQAAIGDIDTSQLNDFKTPLTVSTATVLGLPLIRATARAQISLGGVTWQNVRFNAADIANQTLHTVKTDDLVQGLTTSLLQQTQINVSVAGLGLNLGGVTSAVGGLLTPVGPPLDGVLNGLLDTLGLGLGEADVQVNGLRCNGSALVI
ncbi:pilus assembly protein TadG-related protein [Asticcacaulis sp. EMRT-3]|uniref:pilus assembly protein TadG-related protein n=1 Tax=Asticcacaulis sp. EMRT-3 TaxID=3040349 RepID=UPI0024AF3B5C|nr:pilus assembly protein TadG-related protein [Asticcacaulis sp. EMRT-3]MDI7774303.1 pilus assembly protein TadG-related protein [Asticcacaulis sp. EMRT-3]